MNLKLLKKKDFSLLIFGEMVSLIGTQFQDFALALYVLKTTGSAAKFASIMAIALLPQLILGPFAGVFVDWFDRKKIVVILNFINGIIAFSLAIIFYCTGSLKLSYIYIAVILMAINQLMFTPAVGTIIPTIMNKEDLIQANSIQSFVQGSAIVASPMLAGAIYGFRGALPILMFNSISFIFASLCEMFIKLPKNNLEKTKINFKNFISDFKEGILFIKNEKLILAVVLSGIAINFSLSAMSSVGLTFILKKVLKISDFQYGTTQAIICIPLIIAPIFIGKLKNKEFSKIFKIVIILVCFLVGAMSGAISPIYIAAFSTSLVPVVSLTILFFILIFLVTIANVLLSTIFQSKVPNSMLGRVSSVFGTFITAACPLGQMIFAFLFDNISAYIVILLAVLPLIAALIVFCYAAKEKNSNTLAQEI